MAAPGKTLCVYAASSDAVDPAYLDAAGELGGAMARAGHTLIYGAGHMGLMGAVARGVHAEGGHVTGVIPEKLDAKDLAYREADELIVTTGMRERKAIMEDRADAFITLPGGFGTLEELLEVLVLKQLAYHEKPIVLLNTRQFFEPLRLLIDHLVVERFVKPSHRSLCHFADTPTEALDYITHYEAAPAEGKWFEPKY